MSSPLPEVIVISDDDEKSPVTPTLLSHPVRSPLDLPELARALPEEVYSKDYCIQHSHFPLQSQHFDRSVFPLKDLYIRSSTRSRMIYHAYCVFETPVARSKLIDALKISVKAQNFWGHYPEIEEERVLPKIDEEFTQAALFTHPSSFQVGDRRPLDTHGCMNPWKFVENGECISVCEFQREFKKRVYVEVRVAGKYGAACKDGWVFALKHPLVDGIFLGDIHGNENGISKVVSSLNEIFYGIIPVNVLGSQASIRLIEDYKGGVPQLQVLACARVSDRKLMLERLMGNYPARDYPSNNWLCTNDEAAVIRDIMTYKPECSLQGRFFGFFYKVNKGGWGSLRLFQIESLQVLAERCKEDRANTNHVVLIHTKLMMTVEEVKQKIDAYMEMHPNEPHIEVTDLGTGAYPIEMFESESVAMVSNFFRSIQQRELHEALFEYTHTKFTRSKLLDPRSQGTVLQKTVYNMLTTRDVRNDRLEIENETLKQKIKDLEEELENIKRQRVV